MHSNEIVEKVLRDYHFENYPIKYKNLLIEVLDLSRNIFKDNMLSFTLGGSGGKNKIIEGWSDLDIYIVLNKYNIADMCALQKVLSSKDIHVGLTFYNLYELNHNLIDFKTKVMIYEKNNYNVNPTIYGDNYFHDVKYGEIYINDFTNYPQVLQNFRRIFMEVLNKQRKIDKSYIKKMLVLIKCILSSHMIFVYGYNEVYQEFYRILNNTKNKFVFDEIFKDIANKEEKIIKISYEILEYVEKEELFKNNKVYSKHII